MSITEKHLGLEVISQGELTAIHQCLSGEIYIGLTEKGIDSEQQLRNEADHKDKSLVAYRLINLLFEILRKEHQNFDFYQHWSSQKFHTFLVEERSTGQQWICTIFQYNSPAETLLKQVRIEFMKW